jgi:NitT/TauT family transport system substrate-binding protein
VLSGATRGGSALVVQGDGRIKAPEDFRGRRVGTPQLGNTQDVACRAWLRSHGFRVTATGGDVTVIPMAHPDQLTLFGKGDLDAAWTVEPWVSRIEKTGGVVFLEEADALTTVLVASARLVRERPEVARILAESHRGLTKWLQDHPNEAQAEVRAELAAETRIEIPADVPARAWKRMRFDDGVSRDDFETLVRSAKDVGFLEDAIPLERLVVELR